MKTYKPLVAVITALGQRTASPVPSLSYCHLVLITTWKRESRPSGGSRRPRITKVRQWLKSLGHEAPRAGGAASPGRVTRGSCPHSKDWGGDQLFLCFCLCFCSANALPSIQFSPRSRRPQSGDGAPVMDTPSQTCPWPRCTTTTLAVSSSLYHHGTWQVLVNKRPRGQAGGPQ